jgi:hypothetical protein
MNATASDTGESAALRAAEQILIEGIRDLVAELQAARAAFHPEQSRLEEMKA